MSIFVGGTWDPLDAQPAADQACSSKPEVSRVLPAKGRAHRWHTRNRRVCNAQVASQIDGSPAAWSANT